MGAQTHSKKYKYDFNNQSNHLYFYPYVARETYQSRAPRAASEHCSGLASVDLGAECRAKSATLARPHSGARDAESKPSGSAGPLKCGGAARSQSLPPGELGVAGGPTTRATAVSTGWERVMREGHCASRRAVEVLPDGQTR